MEIRSDHTVPGEVLMLGWGYVTRVTRIQSLVSSPPPPPILPSWTVSVSIAVLLLLFISFSADSGDDLQDLTDA
jgi:hypothetical protein